MHETYMLASRPAGRPAAKATATSCNPACPLVVIERVYFFSFPFYYYYKSNSPRQA